MASDAALSSRLAYREAANDRAEQFLIESCVADRARSIKAAFIRDHPLSSMFADAPRGEREIDTHRKVCGVWGAWSKEWLGYVEWPMCKVPLRYTYRKLDYFRVTYGRHGPRLPPPRAISSSSFATVLKGGGMGQGKTKSLIRRRCGLYRTWQTADRRH